MYFKVKQSRSGYYRFDRGNLYYSAEYIAGKRKDAFVADYMEKHPQEAGRAGRDGENAKCILLFSVQDIMIGKFLLEKKEFEGTEEENPGAVVSRELEDEDSGTSV